MLDGRHTGTGGGNHVVLGGATPADSPFLRRPDLLRSLIAYWHNHPSLSYLFSGLFIGPTSQAPRVDEARHDSLYELEIAFAADRRASTASQRAAVARRSAVPQSARSTSPATRTAPSSASTSSTRPTRPTGRLGLLEFRAFEMPPHARMSLAQQLLLRALVARFWQEPYRRRLVRWGTELHDRFMLPHFVGQDFEDVIDDLTRAGYRIEPRGSRRTSSSASRCSATSRTRGVELELRQALEPWHVLGEEGARRRHGALRGFVGRAPAGARSRGMSADRYVVTCNGRARAAAADRRARRIRRRRPLPRLAAAVVPAPDDPRPRAADLRPRRHVDRAARSAAARTTSRIRAGATTSTFPVNALRGREPPPRALLRRRPHAGRDAHEPPATPHPEFPFTLDLRRAHLRQTGRRCTLGFGEHAGVRHVAASRARIARRRSCSSRLRSPRRACSTRCSATPAPCGRTGATCSTRSPQWAREADALPRRTSAQRLLDENGVTYNVYGDPSGTTGRGSSTSCRCSSPRRVGAARARPDRSARACSNALLADLYGAQRAARRTGLLPPALVFGNPASCGRATASACRDGLHLHLVRVRPRARAPDGRWCVLGDRTQAPSGAGYALENRIVIVAALARGFPRLQRAAARAVLPRVHAATLRALAQRRHAGRGRAAHAGPVQRDLLRARLPRALPRLHARRGRRSHRARRPRVSEDRSTGLKPVDVILRRLDDDFCDPLELRSGLVARRAGLVQAARARQRRRSPTRSAAASRREPAFLQLPAGLEPLLPRRGAAAAVRRDVVVRRSRASASTCSTISTSSSSSRRSRRRSLFGSGRMLRDAPSSTPTSASALVHDDRARGPRLRRQEPRRALDRAGLVDASCAGTAARDRAARLRRGDRRAATRSCPAGSRASPSARIRARSGLDAARRREQGHLGALRSAGRARSACSRSVRRANGCTAAGATCRAAPPTTCSGSAATPSAPKAPCGCCAAS